MSNSILRRLASRFTSCITGSAPVPVPTTRRRHCHGIFSSRESGVCPNSASNFLEGFFLRLRTHPRSITTSCSCVTPSMRMEPKVKSSNRIPQHLFGHYTPCHPPPTQIKPTVHNREAPEPAFLVGVRGMERGGAPFSDFSLSPY